MSQTKQTVSVRQNFSEESENLINQLINTFLVKSYTCNSMAYYFDRDDVGQFGMADFNRWCARDGYLCARILMDYVIVRGGKVVFDTVRKPEKMEWGSPVESLQSLLDIKRCVYEQVLKVYKNACDNNDPHLTDFLETEIIRPLVEFIRKVGVLVSNCRTAGPNIGEYQFNKDLELHLVEIMRESKLGYTQYTSVFRDVNVPYVPYVPYGSTYSSTVPGNVNVPGNVSNLVDVLVPLVRNILSVGVSGVSGMGTMGGVTGYGGMEGVRSTIRRPF